MKILMLVDWRVARLKADSDTIQSPDKIVTGRPYWFFKYWPDPVMEVDVLDIGNLPWIHSVEGGILHFYVIQSLIAYLKRKKYDLIISHSARSALVFAFLRSMVKERSPLHVVIDVGCFNGGRDNAAELFLIKQASRSLGGIITHSSIQSGYYDRYMPHVPYRFIPFGVDADYFRPMDLRQEDFILSFGSRARDYPTMLEAWTKVSHKNTRLKIIGIDKIPGIDYTPANVDLLGRVPVKSLMSHMARARFIVIPLPNCKYSCGQMSFLQSMAMRKSCIVTKTPSSEDYLRDAYDALLVCPHDPEDLADKINVLLQDDALIASVGRKARQTIEARYNEQNMARDIYKFISTFI